jgi:hypothetical protein
MKVLVQHRITLRYLSAAGRWKTELEDAHDFLSCINVVPFCQKQNISNYRVILKFENSRYDIILDREMSPHPRAAGPVDGKDGNETGLK